MNTPCIVIVDPYTSGVLLAESLVREGARCIAIRTEPFPDRSLRETFRPEPFQVVIPHRGDLPATIAAVERERPTQVVAGSSMGIELADFLCQQLKLRSNGTESPLARNDKFLMSEVVRAHGLRVPKQFASSDIDCLLESIERELEWPVVLKPVRSVGSDHVTLCENEAQAFQAADAILKMPNRLGRKNRTVLAQEHLNGAEYVVDTVSCDGRHKVVAFWSYDKPTALKRDGWYDAMTMLDFDGELQLALRTYAFQVLDALGIRHGAAHSEIMWSDNQPVLIEVNARLTGGSNSVAGRECGVPCQLDEAVSALLYPERFLASLDDPVKLARYLSTVFLLPLGPGKFLTRRGIEQIENLPSFQRIAVTQRPGEPIGRCAGIVTLVAAGMAEIRKDIEAIRALEREGLFESVESPASCELAASPQADRAIQVD